MSGIVGSKLNIRGSGLVGSLGTDGQHLLSAGAGKTNVFETAAGGGAWTFLDRTTIDDDATVDIETGIDSTYPLYVMVFDMFKPVDDGSGINARVKQGGSYQTGSSYRYHTTTTLSSQSALDYNQSNSSAASTIEIISVGIGNAAHENVNGVVYLPNPSSTTIYKNFWWRLSSLDASTTYTYTQGFGGYDDDAAVTGIQFYIGSGNVDSGFITTYGIKNS